MSAVSLSSFEGKNISDICDSNFHDDSYNHCAQLCKPCPWVEVRLHLPVPHRYR